MIEEMKVDTKNFSFQGISNNNNDDDKIITGFAINPGVYHQFIEVPESEMQNAVDTIQGSIVLKDHQNMTDNAIGRVFESENKINPVTNKRACYYEATIDSKETDLIRKINKNIIDSCSIGFSYEPICAICGEPLEECNHWLWDDGFGIIAKNVNIHELSVVSVPADANATVSVSEFAHATFSDELLKLKDSNKGEKNMDSKYEKLNEEFAKFKADSEEEMKKVKEDHDARFSEKVEECLSIKAEKEALQSNYDELKNEYDELKIEADKIQEAKLADLRSEVLKLNEEISAGLKEDEVAGYSESTLLKYKDMFANIAEAHPKVTKPSFENKKYDDGLKEDASSLEKLMHTVSTL